MTVVCVDMNWIVLFGLKNKVKKILPEADVYTCRNSTDALSIAREHGCDVLITEIDFGREKEEGIRLAQEMIELNLIIPALDTATFHVEASGSSLRYQWQWSTDKKTWKNCTSTGYNTGTFSFIAKPSYDGRYYRCRVSDGTDILYSGGAHLTVTD